MGEALGNAADADLWRLTLQHSPIGMAMMDLEGRAVMVNHALSEMLGYDEAELLKRGFQDITLPEDMAEVVDHYRRTLAGDIDSYRLRKRYLHADGHVVWGDLSVALVRDSDGRPLRFVAQVLDITAQRDYEERLKEATAEIEHERQSLEAIFEAVNVGLLLIGADGHYERMNRRHAETMSKPFPDGHDGQAGQLGEVYLPDGRTLMDREAMPTYRAMQGEEFDDYTYWVGRDPQTRAAYSTSARQVRGPGGERLGAALAYQEITDLMRAMQVQDEFVSSVSHELRTPLTSVLGHLEMLCERNGLPEDVTAQLLIVQRNALRLRALLTDLLHVGQISEGSLQLQLASVDLARVVDEAAEAARGHAEGAGIRLEVDAPAQLSATVDEQRIRQVLDNLLSNGIKYSEPGAVVRICLCPRADGCEIRVSDTGMGIAPDEVQHVFDRFFRGDSALEKHIPGTGLGLNIVRSIVTAHGGEMSLESELGVGTTFRVTLPLTD